MYHAGADVQRCLRAVRWDVDKAIERVEEIVPFTFVSVRRIFTNMRCMITARLAERVWHT